MLRTCCTLLSRLVNCVISLIHVRFLSRVISLIHVRFLSCVISLIHVRFLSCVISLIVLPTLPSPFSAIFGKLPVYLYLTRLELLSALRIMGETTLFMFSRFFASEISVQLHL